MDQLDSCKFCHFEYDEEYTRDDWDILDLNHDVWEHNQIYNRLWAKGIEVMFADIWIDDMAFLLGCNAHTTDIANVLGVHEKCIYEDYEHMLIIINLFEEKCIRRRENNNQLFEDVRHELTFLDGLGAFDKASSTTSEYLTTINKSDIITLDYAELLKRLDELEKE